jgi:hypothetical protein
MVGIDPDLLARVSLMKVSKVTFYKRDDSQLI